MIEQMVTKSYTLSATHIAVIEQVAQEHGGTGASAALRYILDEYARQQEVRNVYDAHRAGMLTTEQAADRLQEIG